MKILRLGLWMFSRGSEDDFSEKGVQTRKIEEKKRGDKKSIDKKISAGAQPFIS